MRTPFSCEISNSRAATSVLVLADIGNFTLETKYLYDEEYVFVGLKYLGFFSFEFGNKITGCHTSWNWSSFVRFLD